MKKALVVFSGGQDSSTCLYYALKNYDYVYTIGFAYGQRHSIEMECRQEFIKALKNFDKELCKKLGPDRVVDMLSFKDLTDSALTKDSGSYELNDKNNLPTSFVPGRNLIFLSYAASYAYTIGADTIITGVGQADYSGYPDCRDETIKALEKALNLGMESNLNIETPLMFKDKEIHIPAMKASITFCMTGDTDAEFVLPAFFAKKGMRNLKNLCKIC